MKPLTKTAWDKVHEKACDIANAVMAEDQTMADIHTTYMFELLTDLESEFGMHPAILATRADYTDDAGERRRLYESALRMARERGGEVEIAEILDSLRCLEEEEG